jgi:hypothetical protein
VCIAVNTHTLYDSIRRDIHWKKQFAEFGAKMPTKCVAMSHFAKGLAAFSGAWFIYLLLK